MVSLRLLGGGIACGLYVWRVQDPRTSYVAFFDASDWLTGLVLAADGASGVVKNIVGLVLVDQADGFLLGIVFFSILSAIGWLLSSTTKACGYAVRRATGRQRREKPGTNSDKHAL